MIVQLTSHYLKTLKRQLQEQCTGAKSAHLTEAIANGCGYRTNAALQTDLIGGGEGRFLRFNEDAFRTRLEQLSGSSAPEELDLPELSHSGRYVEHVLDNSALEVIELRPLKIRFRLAGIATVISIELYHTGTGVYRFVRSHAIHTPSQAGPYWPGRDFDDDPAYGMHRAISSISDYYEQAVAEGHKPSASWLIAA